MTKEIPGIESLHVEKYVKSQVENSLHGADTADTTALNVLSIFVRSIHTTNCFPPRAL